MFRPAAWHQGLRPAPATKTDTPSDVLTESGMLTDGRQLLFSIDGPCHRVVVRVVNAQTGEVLDQVPAERLLQFADSPSLQSSENRLYA